MIYMDNAATTKMTPAVIQAMLLCMEDIWYNPSSLYAPAQAGARTGKRRIVSTAIERHAVLHTLKKLEREGYEAELLDISSSGIISVAQVERAIREDTCLVTVMYANNEIGSIQPISEIGAICRKKGVPTARKCKLFI